MAKVEIYTKPTCPYCAKAKALLEKKGVSYEEYNIAGDEALRAKMIERASGRHTVPQIFIDGKGVGGCDDIHMMDVNDELDPLLNG